MRVQMLMVKKEIKGNFWFCSRFLFGQSSFYIIQAFSMSKVLNTFPGKRIQLSSISKSPALTARIVRRGNIGPSSTCTVTVFKEQTCQQWHSWINLFLRHPGQLLPDGVLLPWPGCEAARLLCRPPHLPRPRPAQSQLR